MSEFSNSEAADWFVEQDWAVQRGVLDAMSARHVELCARGEVSGSVTDARMYFASAVTSMAFTAFGHNPEGKMLTEEELNE